MNKILIFFSLLLTANVSFCMEADCEKKPKTKKQRTIPENIQIDLEAPEAFSSKQNREIANISKNCPTEDTLENFRQKTLTIFIVQALNDFPEHVIKYIYQYLYPLFRGEPLKSMVTTVFNEPIENIDLERSPFIISIFLGYQELIKQLFEVEKSLNKLDIPIGKLQLTPLFVAVILKNEDLVDLLIGAGANVNAKTSKSQSVLMTAINSTPKIIDALIDAKAEVEYRNQDQHEKTFDETFLDQAIHKNPKIAAYFINNYNRLLNVHSANSEGKTPLMLAVECGRAEIVNLLVKKGFDVNVKDTNGHTALFFAIPHPPILKYLLREKAEVNNRDCDNRTLLMYACVENTDSTEALINAGADVNATDEHGKNCLMLALEDEEKETAKDIDAIVELLLKAGINLNAVNSDNHSTLFYAFLYHNFLMPKLIKAGADPNISKIEDEEVRERFLNHCQIAKNYENPRRKRSRK